MSVAMIAALLALALSLLARRHRRSGRLELDDVVIALVLHVGLVAVVATLLAWLGWLSVTWLVAACVLLALACWPWTAGREGAGRDPVPVRSHARVLSWVLFALVGIGVALRVPAIPAELAGRDQGTYVLRAHASLRTGSLGFTDPVLARAGRELESGTAAAGTYDILGLYPIGDDAWRRDHYDGAYRPGAYLGDREAGEVVPQFFHLHPMLLAVGGATFGPERATFVLPWLAALWLACLACCARRLWPRGAWAVLAVALVVGSPLAIWTARTPLSENPMALFEWTAVLVALRLRDSAQREQGGGWLIASCLGLCALTRGNALLLLPIVLALAWLRPRGSGTGVRAAWLLLGLLLASVVVHAATTYPYVHDELLRQLPNAQLGPRGLVGVAGLGALVWLLLDRLAARLPGRPRVLMVVPRVLVLGCFAAAMLWWVLWRDAPPGRPFSRLDAAPILLGLPLLASAGVGLIVIARRWRPGPEQFWLVALASLVPATALLYAPRQLPQLAFFYYGRYLVPELLPAVAFAATAGIAAAVAWLAGPKKGPKKRLELRRLVAGGLGIVAALGLLWSSARPLVEHPQVRLREYDGAGAAVRWLAARMPAGAIVIAGGEGWHSGHTHNQVGGALAFSHGVTVLPYRTREDAWVTAWELLVAGPQRRGEEPPPVFLLVNEAAHQSTRRDGNGDVIPVALLDEQLWAPFFVERASLLELFVHALTPVADQLPTRVARHELRMGLLRLQVDPEALARIERLELGQRPPAGVRVSGGLHDDGRTCVSPERPLTITIPRSDSAAHVVVITEVANEPMSRRIGEWSVRIDGVELPPPKGLPLRPRATLGPLPLPLHGGPGESPETLTVELLGVELSPDALGPEPCRYGHVAAIVVLPRERSSVFALEPERIEVTTLEPPENLGHAIVPTTWVAGRSLSRYRAGTTPTPELAGFALRLPAGGSLTFAPIDLPRTESGRVCSLDVIVTLAGTSTVGESQLHVYAGEQRVGTIHPPAMRTGSWIAEPFALRSDLDRAQLRVELDSPTGGSVDLRDVALFCRP